MTITLRGDKQCPHGHTARRKCQDCEREDDQKEIERLRSDLTACQLERDEARRKLDYRNREAPHCCTCSCGMEHQPQTGNET